MVNYNDGNWHIWNGGECPVHPETVVEVALTDHAPCVETAEQWFWVEDKTRIIAFRVIKEHKEPREWIMYDDGLGNLASWTGGDRPHRDNCIAIKVREVVE